MMETITLTALPTVLLFLGIALGVWLARDGRPALRVGDRLALWGDVVEVLEIRRDLYGGDAVVLTMRRDDSTLPFFSGRV